MDKKSARSYGLAARKHLSQKEKSLAEESVLQKLLRLVQSYERIGVYVSMQEELDTHRFIDGCLANGIEVCIPKVVGKTLQFYSMSSWENLERSAFGVWEPTQGNPIPISAIPLQIIPLSSFDAAKHRTGYGRGYYDSILQEDVYKVGIAFACQEVDSIAVDAWDVTLDTILTEEKDIV